jgi:hypothetical protein
VHQESVVDAGQGIDGVDVGREEYSGLGFAEPDDTVGGQPSQDGAAFGTLDEAADLGEDIVGERVARMVQGRITLRVLAFQ